jgi:hypothetical protein
MLDYTITPTLHEGDDGLVHIRLEVEVPVHPSDLTDPASIQTLARDVGKDVTAELMEKFEEVAAGPGAPA